jgi:Ca2+-binding RTX toxin-like protein
LILTGTTAINGTGNSANNTITGNAANNTLDGGGGNDILNGGTGTDTMAGGAGNDTYLVDNAGDVVTELAGEGTDTVQASISYTLGSNLENLILTGTTAINGTGNSANNRLTGNAANNTLDGGGGADTMTGGSGDDTYFVDNTRDLVTELAGHGTDTVQAAISYTLGSNLENLILTGTTAINGTGNSANNTITGNAASNTLDGGEGIDILTGQGGADTFNFFNKQTLDASTCDHITDFSSNDTIQISRSAFGISSANLSFFSCSGSSELTVALASNALFVYDTSSGYLYWNQNGHDNGTGSGGIFAALDNYFSGLTASNIKIII